MFTPRQLHRQVTQKSRGKKNGNLLLLDRHIISNNSMFALSASSSGFLHRRCLETFFTHTKKTLNIPQKSTKFWLNLHACHVVSRKALNVRMGKGKGSRIGINARVSVGNFLVKVTRCRFGLWLKLLRFFKSRCSFRVVSNFRRDTIAAAGRCNSALFFGGNTPTRTTTMSQKRYITSKIFETLGTLQRLGQIQTYVYFKQLFRYYRRTSVYILSSVAADHRGVFLHPRYRHQRSKIFVTRALNHVALLAGSSTLL